MAARKTTDGNKTPSPFETPQIPSLKVQPTTAGSGNLTPEQQKALAARNTVAGGMGATPKPAPKKTTKKKEEKKKTPPPEPAVDSTEWQKIIQEEFGSLWDVYNDNPDVKAVIDKSVKEGWFNDSAKLASSLQSTAWFKNTQQSVRQYKLRQSTDPATLEAEITSQVDTIKSQAIGLGYTLPDATYRRIAEDNIKYKYNEAQLTKVINSEYVAESQAAGATGRADLRQGAVARNLYSKAAAYFQKPSQDQIDTWTAEILRGNKSETQWEDLMRDSARTQFRSLAPALDKGQDVDTAMYAYKQQAQSILGSATDTNNIDWTQDKWNKALNYQDPKTGEYRQMDLYEWNKYLRSLPEWQETDQAKDVYRNVAYSLAQGFGKMA